MRLYRSSIFFVLIIIVGGYFFLVITSNLLVTTILPSLDTNKLIKAYAEKNLTGGDVFKFGEEKAHSIGGTFACNSWMLDSIRKKCGAIVFDSLKTANIHLSGIAVVIKSPCLYANYYQDYMVKWQRDSNVKTEPIYFTKRFNQEFGCHVESKLYVKIYYFSDKKLIYIKEV